MNRFPRWTFEQDEDGRWRWTHAGVQPAECSHRSFRTRIECVLDAMKHAVRQRRVREGREPH